MRLDELVLHNVGPYRGEHTVVLTPPSPDRPVVLFGGLNGAGKTTLLEAIQLSLYGNLAEPARRSGLAYDEYLARAANRASPPSEGSAVGIAFTVQEGGKTRHYRVRRAWTTVTRGAKRARESLDVWVDGEADTALASAWADQVVQFLPPRLAPLFFFDGERIEQLADPEQSADALRAAIGALLGADLVDALQTDLTATLRRIRVATAEQDDSRLEPAERARDEADAARRRAMQDAAAAETALARAEELLRRAERAFTEQGGHAAAERHENEARRAALTAERDGVARALGTLAAGDLPLSLVRPLLERALARAKRSIEEEDRARARDGLGAAGARLLNELEVERVAARTLSLVRDWIERECATPDSAFDPMPSARAFALRAEQLLEGGLERAQGEAGARLERHAALSGSLEAIERTLAMTPDEGSLRERGAEREAALVQVGRAREARDAAVAAVGEATRQHKRLTREADKLLEAAHFARREASDDRRFTRHTAAVQTVLERFAARLRARHLARLEGLVLECYRALMRKTELAQSIRIDPESYALRVTDADGVEVRAERLSAGERQLLAVAMLWAMGQASRRALPVAVDTPLGRLDGEHRRRLVERYFPNAAKQVLLFSTDEEVDAELYTVLAPHVGRAYRLDHDERGGTTVREGYPFAEVAAKVVSTELGTGASLAAKRAAPWRVGDTLEASP